MTSRSSERRFNESRNETQEEEVMPDPTQDSGPPDMRPLPTANKAPKPPLVMSCIRKRPHEPHETTWSKKTILCPGVQPFSTQSPIDSASVRLDAERARNRILEQDNEDLRAINRYYENRIARLQRMLADAKKSPPLPIPEPQNVCATGMCGACWKCRQARPLPYTGDIHGPNGPTFIRVPMAECQHLPEHIRVDSIRSGLSVYVRSICTNCSAVLPIPEDTHPDDTPLRPSGDMDMDMDENGITHDGPAPEPSDTEQPDECPECGGGISNHWLASNGDGLVHASSCGIGGA